MEGRFFIAGFFLCLLLGSMGFLIYDLIRTQKDAAVANATKSSTNLNTVIGWGGTTNILYDASGRKFWWV
jgi:hypothetical protein